MNPHTEVTPTSVAFDLRSRTPRRALLFCVFASFLVAASVQLRAAAPEITSISPSRGPEAGGTLVFLSGTGFTGATQVTFGGVNATTFSVQSDTSIQATTPAGTLGVVDVVVTTPDGSTTLKEGFGYGVVPLAINDTYSATFNQTLSVNSPGVLSNDDPNGGGGWVSELGDNAAHGTVTFTADGGFTYVPTTGFAGSDKFTYRSRNNSGFSNFATVTINVAGPTTPLPPTGLYASVIQDNRVTLRFTPPQFGLTPTAYIIEGGLTPGSVAATFVIPPTPIFTLDAPNGTFFIRVRTRAGGLTSDPSNEILIFVNTPAVPSSPENLIASVVGDRLNLAWRNSYGGGTPGLLVLDVSGSVSASLPLGFADKATFTGVPAGTYTLSLRAVNSTGSSFPSAAVTVTVPDTCSGIPSCRPEKSPTWNGRISRGAIN